MPACYAIIFAILIILPRQYYAIYMISYAAATRASLYWYMSLAALRITRHYAIIITLHNIIYAAITEIRRHLRRQADATPLISKMIPAMSATLRYDICPATIVISCH